MIRTKLDLEKLLKEMRTFAEPFDYDYTPPSSEQDNNTDFEDLEFCRYINGKKAFMPQLKQREAELVQMNKPIFPVKNFSVTICYFQDVIPERMPDTETEFMSWVVQFICQVRMTSLVVAKCERWRLFRTLRNTGLPISLVYFVPNGNNILEFVESPEIRSKFYKDLFVGSTDVFSTAPFIIGTGKKMKTDLEKRRDVIAFKSLVGMYYGPGIILNDVDVAVWALKLRHAVGNCPLPKIFSLATLKHETCRTNAVNELNCSLLYHKMMVDRVMVYDVGKYLESRSKK